MLSYPYFLQSEQFSLFPIFGEQVKGEPIFVSMADEGGIFNTISSDRQDALQAYLVKEMEKKKTTIAFSAYLEPRKIMIEQKGCKEMVETTRYYHLGLDISISSGAKVYAPLDSEVVTNYYEEGNGQYGGMIVLKHELKEGVVFYSVYGHLHHDPGLRVGTKLNAGDFFTRIGEYEENGQWFTHLHLQILTQKAYEEGWENKGYCTEADLAHIRELCPDPSFLFRY